MNSKRARRISIAFGINNPSSQYVLSKAKNRSSRRGQNYFGVSRLQATNDSLSKMILDLDPVNPATDQLSDLLITPIPAPSLVGWRIISPPKDHLFPGTYIVEFQKLNHVALRSIEQMAPVLSYELSVLSSGPWKIIFKLPTVVPASQNVVRHLIRMNTELKNNGGMLFFCSSNRETFLALHNENLPIYWDLEEATKALEFEIKFNKTLKMGSRDKTFLLGGGIVYTSP